jgi:hypothetical protein
MLPLHNLVMAEVVLGFVAAILGVLAARASYGGKLSAAITWIVVGLITMSIGHMIMAYDLLNGGNIMGEIFGALLGGILFRVAVIFSFSASIIGFWKLWRMTKQ